VGGEAPEKKPETDEWNTTTTPPTHLIAVPLGHISHQGTDEIPRRVKSGGTGKRLSSIRGSFSISVSLSARRVEYPSRSCENSK
jgi:hypothetical protein